MSRGFINMAIFLAGGIVGAGIAVYLTKETFRQIAEERADIEIESVKETWRRKYEPNDDSEDASDVSREDIDEALRDLPKREPFKVRRREERTNYSNSSKVENDDGEPNDERTGDELPYVIPPDQFGELDNYTQIELTYFSDLVLVDTSTGEAVQDIDGTVGIDSLISFGVYEEDSVYVRNDLTECDYLILADERTYEDFVNARPHSRGDR